MRFSSWFRVAIGVCAWCSLVVDARGITSLDIGYGTPTGTSLGRAAAMGSTGVSLFQGSAAVVQNPALLSLQPQRLYADFLFGVTHLAEDRLVPLYDSFNAYVDETTVATNRNTYTVAQGGLVWRLPFTHPMSIAAGVYERYDFDYDYFEEARNPDPFDPMTRDELLAERTVAVQGLLRSAAAGFATDLVARARLGASVHYYFGDVESAVRETDFQANTSTTATLLRQLDGWGWSVGAHGSVTDRIDVAVAFEGPFQVAGPHHLRETDTALADPVVVDSSSDETIDYPGALRFGGTYRPQNQLATTFSVEAVRRFWDELEDSFRTNVVQETFVLRDTWDLRLGLEHVFYNGLPVRFGFRYLENYADPEAARSIYSAGLGYRFERIRFDITALYHRQTSRQQFLFDPSLPGFPAPNSSVKVQDSVLQLVIGIQRGF